MQTDVRRIWVTGLTTAQRNPEVLLMLCHVCVCGNAKGPPPTTACRDVREKEEKISQIQFQLLLYCVNPMVPTYNLFGGGGE